MKFNEKIKFELDSLEREIKESLKDIKLSQILKYLIKGIVKYKDGDLEESIHLLGKCVVLCQGHLFHVLNSFSIKKENPPKRGSRPAFYFDTLYYKFFKELEIKNLDIVSQARKVYTKRSNEEHKESPNQKHHPHRKLFPKIITTCIKQYLLVIFISNFLSGLLQSFNKENLKQSDKPDFFRRQFRVNKINIEEKYYLLFQKQSKEILTLFNDLLFNTDIKFSLRDNKIIKEKLIKNSIFLKKYFPLVLFSNYRFERILESIDVIPFRPDGPHIKDFNSKVWIYIPQAAKNILKVLNIKKFSILISAPSGYGKTVIARYLGYELSRKDYIVFYIDILNHEKSELKSLIDQIYYSKENLNDTESILFIFENIHVLNSNIDKDLLKKMNIIKNNIMCIFTRRIFLDQENDLELTFNRNQLINFEKSSSNFKQTVKGMINKNAANSRMAKQLQNYNFGNLWVHAILLKTYNIHQKRNLSLIDIFKDTELFGNSIAELFKQLLISEYVEIDLDDYTNGINFLLSLISIFSELEYWVEKDFIKKILKIRERALGRLNKELNLDYKVIKDITSFLIKIHEIQFKVVKYNRIFDKIEFRIPHSQMALIYKNVFLNTFEDLYPGLTLEIIQLYLFEGNHYGNFIHERNLAWIRANAGLNFDLSKRLYISFSKIMEANNSDRIKEQILRNSLSEFNNFIYGFSMLTTPNLFGGHKETYYFDKKDIEDYRKEQIRDNVFFKTTIRKIFGDINFLLDSNWKNKIKQTEPKQLDIFFDRIQDLLSDKSFIDFVSCFKEEIFKKLKDSGGTYYISLFIHFISYSKELWSAIFSDFKELIEKSNPTYKDIENIQHLRILEKIDKNHYSYEIFQIYIRNFIKYANVEDQKKMIYNLVKFNLDFYSEIYLDLIKANYLNSNSNGIDLGIHIDSFIINNTLEDLTSFLFQFSDSHDELIRSILKKHQVTFKKKIESEEIQSVCDFFDWIFKSEILFSVSKTIFLSDWKWFSGLFTNLELEDLKKVFNALRYFFPFKLKKYKDELFQLIDSLIKKRIQQHYELLKDKTEVFELLKKVSKPYYARIISLFRKEINASIEIQELQYFTSKLKRIENRVILNKEINQIWDFEQFILNEKFQDVVLNSNQNDIKDFFSVILKYFYPIAKNVIIKYKTLLENEECLKNYLEISIPETFNQETKKILKALKDKDFTNFCVLCNSRVGKYELFSVPLIHFVIGLEDIKDLILLTQSECFSAEIKKFILAMHPFYVFNLLVILYKLDEKLFEDFLILFKEVVNEKLHDLHIQSLEVVTALTTILGIYHLQFNFLNKLDEIFKDLSLFQRFFKELNRLDLLTFRFLTMRFPLTIKDVIVQFDINIIMKNSSLLQISLGLVNYTSQLSIKIPPKPYIAYNPRMIFEVGSKTFHSLTKNLNNFIRNDIFELEEMNQLEIGFYTQNFDFFSGIMLEKLKDAPLEEYYIYFKTINTWVGRIIDEDKIMLSPGFAEYLDSNEFNQRFLSLNIPEMLKFLGEIQKSLKQLPYILFKKNQEVFLSKGYFTILEPYRFTIILNFYSILEENLTLLTNSHKLLLKRKLLEINFLNLISLFNSVPDIIITFLLTNFRHELNDIIFKSSREEIWSSLNSFFNIDNRKKDEFILWLVKKFPFFNDKLSERYFFDF